MRSIELSRAPARPAPAPHRRRLATFASLLALGAGCAPDGDLAGADDPGAAVSAPLRAPTCLDTVDVVIASDADDQYNSQLTRVDTTTGARTALSTYFNPAARPSLYVPHSLVFDAAGRILVAHWSDRGLQDDASILRVDPVTGVRSTISDNFTIAAAAGPLLSNPTGIDVEASGTIVITDSDSFLRRNGGVIRIDPVTGARTTLSRNTAPAGPAFENPIDLAVARNGDIYVLDAGDGFSTGKVLRVDPVNGARTLISKNGAPADPPAFSSPRGIAIEASGNILVSDATAFDGKGGIIRVDPDTGGRTTLSSNDSPSGGASFDQPGDLVIENCGGILVTESQTGCVLRVDPSTGMRTVFSAPSNPGDFSPGWATLWGIAARAGVKVKTDGLPGAPSKTKLEGPHPG